MVFLEAGLPHINRRVKMQCVHYTGQVSQGGESGVCAFMTFSRISRETF